MYYILAADLPDARQWSDTHSVNEWTYVGYLGALTGRTLHVTDTIVRTTRYHEHNFWPEIDMAMRELAVGSRVVETLHGRLVRTGG